MTFTERAGVVLRLARADDLAAIDQLTVDGYAGIQESYVAMLGEDIYHTGSTCIRRVTQCHLG